MDNHKFEIIFDDEKDRTEFVDFVEMNYKTQIDSNDLQLEVEYEIPESQGQFTCIGPETIINIFCAVCNIVGIIPILINYYQEKGKKNTTIIYNDITIDLTNKTPEEVSKILKSKLMDIENEKKRN
jgi:hypothetical protein